jgi:hypothetical protein
VQTFVPGTAPTSGRVRAGAAVPLGEGLVESVERTPPGYARKVAALAAIHVALDLVCVALVATIVWRARHLVTLAQRSNVETALLLIVLVLALFYLATTARGAVGAFRMAALNAPYLWGAPAARVEARKQRALRDGGEPFAAHFDRVLVTDATTPLRWDVADHAGRLGRVEVEDATATVTPAKRGLNNSLLAFVLGEIGDALARRTPPAKLTIVSWSNIDEEESAVYRSTVAAFVRLAERTGGEPLWPTLRLSADDVARVGREIRRVVPALRNEALLPDLEYGVEYTVPVLPEPLAFLQLRRSERRADPILTMGYALVVMATVLLAVLLLIAFPPWVPSK